MTIALIAQAVSPDNAASLNAAGPIDATGASLLWWGSSGSVGTPSDTESNTYAAESWYENVSVSYTMQGYKAAPTVDSSVTLTAQSYYSTAYFLAFTGTHASPLDGQSSAGAGGANNVTTMDTGSVTPSVGGCLCITTLVLSGPASGLVAPTGYTLLYDATGRSNVTHGAVAYKIKSAGDTAAENPSWSWTTARGARAALSVFKPGASTTDLDGAASAVFSATGAMTHGVPLAGSAAAQTTAAGNLSVTHYGILTTPPLKNNAGTVLASETGITVHVYSLAGGLIVTKTGQSTDASGVLVVTDPALVAAIEYRGVIVLASGAQGLFKLTAV